VTLAGQIILKKGREGPVRGGNPWIFSQAIERIDPPTLAAGDWAGVRDAAGASLGYGYFNPATTIAVRMLSFGGGIAPADLIAHRLQAALRLRERIIGAGTNCCRLINGDGDGLSGVVIDRYGDVVVIQLLTAGAERMRGEIVERLGDLIAPRAILERSQGAVRRQEGLTDRAEVIAGEPLAEADVIENGIRLTVDFEHGQKTGWFLDQRDNRALVRDLARGASVFDGYCYAGGFALAALAGGARRVVAADTSARALGWARRNLELNGGSASCELIHDEAARWLAQSRAQFDLVVIDPPPLARSARDAARAAHLYIELNAAAMRAVAPGGIMMTFSCSAHFHGDDFVRAARIAQARANRGFRILRHLGPGGDHPVMLGHAEGEYLTGLLLADIG
jgi:23S rRNA (cytosine1962-C5)-methyltransferase